MNEEEMIMPIDIIEEPTEEELLHNILLDTQEEIFVILDDYFNDNISKANVKEKYKEVFEKRKQARQRLKELEEG